MWCVNRTGKPFTGACGVSPVNASPKKNIIFVVQKSENMAVKRKVQNYYPEAVLPHQTLEDQSKNEICQRLHKNLSVEQLENLEKLAKSMMAKNYIYQDV